MPFSKNVNLCKFVQIKACLGPKPGQLTIFRCKVTFSTFLSSTSMPLVWTEKYILGGMLHWTNDIGYHSGTFAHNVATNIIRWNVMFMFRISPQSISYFVTQCLFSIVFCIFGELGGEDSKQAIGWGSCHVKTAVTNARSEVVRFPNPHYVVRWRIWLGQRGPIFCPFYHCCQ